MKISITTLLVDDSRSVRALIKGVLGSMNSTNLEIAVEEAEDGVQAIEKIRTLSPDIVFMDINMPNMNGLEAAEKIREFNSTVSISMVTSDNGKSTVEKAIGTRIDGYVIKPIQPDKIVEFINKYVEKSIRN